MDSACVAEWMLTQVLPPDRARTTVGDLLEGTAEHSSFWFWTCVIRTLFSCIWNDFAENPVSLLMLGLRGWLFMLCIAAGTFFLVYLAAIFITVPIVILTNLLHIHWPSWQLQPARDIVLWLSGTAWIGWCNFRAGRWIGSKAPGKELAACISAILTPLVFFFLVEIVAMHFWGAEITRFMARHPSNEVNPWGSLPTDVFVFVGALRERRTSTARIAS